MEFVTFKNSSKPKGVAYVRFQQPEDCKSALEYLHPKEDESQEEAKGDGKKDSEEMGSEDKKREVKAEGREHGKKAGTWIDGKIVTVDILDKKYPDEDPIQIKAEERRLKKLEKRREKERKINRN